MADYFFLLVAVTGGIHAITYALWLKKDGNIIGAAAVAGITAAGIGLPLYRIFSNF
jgi:hypothetical protein